MLVRHGSPQSASAARDEVVEGVPSWWLLSGLAPARKCPASQRLSPSRDGEWRVCSKQGLIRVPYYLSILHGAARLL